MHAQLDVPLVCFSKVGLKTEFIVAQRNSALTWCAAGLLALDSHRPPGQSKRLESIYNLRGRAKAELVWRNPKVLDVVCC